MCATPTATPIPTDTGCLGGLWAWLRTAMSKSPAASSKRLLALMACATLCASSAALTGAVVLQVCRHQAVDAQSVLALLGSYTALGTFATVAYRKPEPA